MGMVTSPAGLALRQSILKARIKALQVRLRGSDPLGQRERILKQIQELQVQFLKEK